MDKNKELKEPCKTALKKGYCLGCSGLAEKDFKEPKQCPNLINKGEQIKWIIKELSINIYKKLFKSSFKSKYENSRSNRICSSLI